MKKTIEMVCQGNVTRSQVMRLLAMRKLGNYFRKPENNPYCVDSSGTHVKKIQELDYTREEMISGINFALRNYTFSQKRARQLEALLRSNEGDLKPYFKEAVDWELTEEARYKTIALNSLGLNPAEVQPAKQTIPRKDVILVITADEKNKERVERIYRDNGAKMVPIIASVSELAQMPEIIPLDSLNFQAYMTLINQLVERVPKAIEEAMKRAS